MGDVINLRRVRKTQQRANAEAEAAANRLTHGTPKYLKKSAVVEMRRTDRTIDAHTLDQEKQR